MILYAIGNVLALLILAGVIWSLLRDRNLLIQALVARSPNEYLAIRRAEKALSAPARPPIFKNVTMDDDLEALIQQKQREAALDKLEDQMQGEMV